MHSEIKGYFSSGQQAQSDLERIQIHSGTLVFRQRSYRYDELTISERIGNSPRYIYFPDGGEFETLDNEVIDTWLAALKVHKTRRRLSQMERHFGLALATALGLVLLILLLVVKGIPWGADALAVHIPVEWRVKLSRQAEDLLASSFESSQLPSVRQQRLQQRFQDWTQGSEYPYTLRFVRDEQTVNAFALPSGSIYVTDGLVELLSSDAEVLAVIAHEMGHVERHHGVETLLESSMLSGLMLVTFGDLTQLDALSVTLPTVLFQASYSRDKEVEADRFALDWLRCQGEAPTALIRAFEHMQTYDNATTAEDATGAASNRLALLATHPAISERIEILTAALAHAQPCTHLSR